MSGEQTGAWLDELERLHRERARSPYAAEQYAAADPVPRLVAAARAALDLADELEGYTTRRGRPAPGSYDYGVNLAQADAAELIRARVAAALSSLAGEEQR